jgi:DNA polymerase-3 subunit alpha
VGIFGDDYQKFKHFLEPGLPVFLKASYQPHWKNEYEFQLKIQDMTMLEYIGTDMTKSITLKIFPEQISESLIEGLETLCQTSNGPHILKVEFIDRLNGIKLPFVSKNNKVKVDNQFTTRLQKLGIRYKLN